MAARRSSFPQRLLERRAIEPLICSARGCRAPAAWALQWRNPRLHTDGRHKTWLACAEHRSGLADFLTARSFLQAVVPVQGRHTLEV